MAPDFKIFRLGTNFSWTIFMPLQSAIMKLVTFDNQAPRSSFNVPPYYPYPSIPRYGGVWLEKSNVRNSCANYNLDLKLFSSQLLQLMSWHDIWTSTLGIFNDQKRSISRRSNWEVFGQTVPHMRGSITSKLVKWKVGKAQSTDPRLYILRMPRERVSLRADMCRPEKYPILTQKCALRG